MGAAATVNEPEVIDTKGGTPKLVHLGVTLDGRPPRLALCGAPVGRFSERGLECVVCAEILRGLESGVGE